MTRAQRNARLSTIAAQKVALRDEPAPHRPVPSATMIYITYGNSPYIRVVDCSRRMSDR